MSGQAVPDGIELNKDGTVLCVIEGDRIRLRRPKIGEYRKLEERLDQLDDERLSVSVARADASRRLAEIQMAATSDDAEGNVAETLQSARAALREILQRAESLNLEWLNEAFVMLGDKSLPPLGELPASFLDPELIRDLRKHWRTAPLVRGVG